MSNAATKTIQRQRDRLTPAQTLKIELKSCAIKTMNTVPAPYRVTMMQNTDTYLFDETRGNFCQMFRFPFGKLNSPSPLSDCLFSDRWVGVSNDASELLRIPLLEDHPALAQP